MAAFGDNDLAVFFGDFGVPVIWGGTTATGTLDTPSDGINFGGGPSSLERQQYNLNMPAKAFSRLLKNGDALQVDGSSYKIKGRQLSLDGSIVTYALEVA